MPEQLNPEPNPPKETWLDKRQITILLVVVGVIPLAMIFCLELFKVKETQKEQRALMEETVRYGLPRPVYAVRDIP